MDLEKLKELGLTSAESLIYYTVLKLGKATVKEIAKDSGFHRTNIYDILEKLKEKGLITFYKEGKTMCYGVSDPHNLYELLQEKKESLDSFFPEINGLYNQKSEDIKVEVYKGKEGMKAVFRDTSRIGKPIYAFGAKGQFRKVMPIYAKQVLREWKKRRIKFYGIYTEKYPPSYYTKIKYVPKEMGNPVTILVYGNCTSIQIWEPSMLGIIIRSKLVAHMYKKHFDLLWKIAKD